MQTDLLNGVHPSTIICPVTTNVSAGAEVLRVHLKATECGLRKDSDILVDQIRAVDNKRLIREIGRLPREACSRLMENLRILVLEQSVPAAAQSRIFPADLFPERELAPMLRLRSVRIVLQAAFFALFVLAFFALNRLPTAYRFEGELFLQLNPLAGTLVTLAERSIVLPVAVYTAVMILLSAALGRFFCGMVCPLGALIDFSDRFVTRGMRQAGRRPPRYLQRLKYVLLLGFGVCALFGVLAPLFFDPISLLTRTFALVLHPLLVAAGSDAVRVLNALDIGGGTLRVSARYFYGSLGAAALMGAILLAGFWDRRFWCQYLCPSGAFFGLIGRWSIFRRSVVHEKCNACRLCARQCPTRAIDEADVQRTRVAECIECGVCSSVKTVGCNRFTLGWSGPASALPPDLRRRHMVAGIAGGLALVPAMRADGMLKHDNTGRLIRPPGAVPDDSFAARCIACGECMKACPTNAIQPCGLSDGFPRLYTPKIVPRIGGCEEKCYLCGHVCPTGALRPLTYEQKRFAKIGTAVIDRHKCLPWAQKKDCVVCDEVCPYNAIVPTIVETVKGVFKAPIVYEDLCMGCGYCEHHCPINDDPAIVVYKFGENRRRGGEYVTDSQKADIDRRRKESDASRLQGRNPAFLGSQPDSTAQQPVAGAAPGLEPAEPTSAGQGLPPGFVE